MDFHSTDAASRRVTGVVEKETTSTPASSLLGLSSANPTQCNTSRAYIEGPDLMKRCAIIPEQLTNSFKETTPATDLLGSGHFSIKDL